MKVRTRATTGCSSEREIDSHLADSGVILPLVTGSGIGVKYFKISKGRVERRGEVAAQRPLTHCTSHVTDNCAVD